MKDITINIKENSLKRELIILISAFVIAVLINLYAIITRDGNFIELFTQIGWTIIIGLVIYVLAALIRGIIFGIVSLFQRFQRS